MRYSQIIRVRVSEEMNELVRNEADRLNLKISDYLRWLFTNEVTIQNSNQLYQHEKEKSKKKLETKTPPKAGGVSNINRVFS